MRKVIILLIVNRQRRHVDIKRLMRACLAKFLIFHCCEYGCKAYLKIPKTYLRKDWREKCASGYMMGYSVDGVMGYKS